MAGSVRLNIRLVNILFYTPLNSRCRDIESQAIEFANNGHRIFVASQGKEGELHSSFRLHGFVAVADNKASRYTWLLVLRRCLFLISVCRKFKIDILYSHLEPGNFISVLIQRFVNARVIICRHHIDEAALYAFGRDLSYRLTYKLAKEIIVVSERARTFMIEKEKVPADKIYHIRLAYNFNLYQPADPVERTLIKSDHASSLLLLTVCRLTKFKRPELSILLAERLIAQGFDIKLIVLGTGELFSILKKLIVEKNLQDIVFLKGWVSNVLDYMDAADLIVHPSVLDSSSITLKEAALVSTPMIACKGVGDFDTILDNDRGFTVNADKFVQEATLIVSQYISETSKLRSVGQNCRRFVLEHFEIRNVAPEYESRFHLRPS